MVVLTGVGGRIGGLVAAALARRGVAFRALTRRPELVPHLAGADIVRAAYEEPETLEAALEPGDRVFMVSMHEPPDRRIELHRGFVDVVTRRRVARVVYLSFLGAGSDAAFVHARSHGATESMLAESGLGHTAVRNGMYADEIATWFDASGRITGPGGDGRVSLTYRPELAEAIVELLVEPDHDRRSVVTITGPEAPTLAELAGIASEVTGAGYRYDPLPREQWIAQRRNAGRPEWSIEAGSSYYDGVARGEAGLVSDDYRELTGNEPMSIRDVIDMHRSEMPLVGAVGR